MSFRQPDPQAPLGSDLRPIHQSDYAPIMGGPDYTPPGGGVWAKTVGGTAFHNRMADVCNGAQRRPALYYVDEALKREQRVAWGRYTPESLALWVEECCVATDNVFQPRREDGWVAEICFRYQDPETRYWYEGTIDLLNLQREAERIKSASIIDYKTGETLPDLRLGPQHHEYSLAVKYGVLDHVPYFEDTRLLDWSKMTALPLIPRKWPKEFRFLHVPALLKRGSWFALGMGSDGEPMTEADSLATMRALTKRLLENQPTRLAVAIPAEPQPENEMGHPQTSAIIPAQITQPLHAPKYELSAAEVVAQGQKIQEVMRAAMKVDEDYGIIPGTSRKDREGNEKAKPTLLKPGAEKLLLLFRLAPTFEITKTADGEHREIFVRCKLTHIVSGDFVGEGVGECSTRESKYAWRQADRKCPKCEQPAIFKSKKDGGWFCWDKKGGCGAQFRAGEQSIEGQEIGRKPNPDLADTYNTVTKMACKRALVMAVLNTTGASFLFTQDLEDFAADAPTHYENEVVAQPAPEQPAAPQYTWGEPRGEGYASDAQIKRLKANCAAMGVGEAKCLARIIQLAGEFGTTGIASVAEIPFPVATRIVIKVEEALKAKGIPRPEREKTEAERVDEQVRQIVGELRTKRAKELAELVRSGPLSANEIIDIMANEAAPDTQFSVLAEEQQEQVLHTIKRAAQAAADRVALAANGNGHH